MSSEEDSEVYRKLQEHLDEMPIGYPKTRSGIEIQILKDLFSPEEAEIATYLRYSPVPSDSLDDIYERMKETGISKQELKERLENMGKKGSIHYKIMDKSGEKCYANALFAVGMYEFQVNKITKDFFKRFLSYAFEGYANELLSTKVPQLRTIPISASITPEHAIETYDNVRNVIEEAPGPFCVANCICRQAMDLMGKPCSRTDRREICLGFGNLAKQYIDEGWGREISKKEAYEILKKNEEEGLVIQPSNAREIDFICSCCSCCCGLLLAKKIFPKPAEFFSSNYYAEIDPDLCTGCETCIDICQMEAIKLKDNISTVDRNRCIGCGVCVPQCPSEAIQLRKKDQINPLPNDSSELYTKIMDKKTELIKKKEEKKRRKKQKKNK